MLRAAMYTALLLFGVQAQAEEVTCPDHISTKESLESPTGDWFLRNKGGPYTLERLEFLSGDPKDWASLVPDGTKGSAAGETDTWTFDGQPLPIWLVCEYSNTSVTLMRQLPEAHHECQVAYSPKDPDYSSGQMIRRIQCR